MTDRRRGAHGVGFWLATAAGAALIAVGIRQLLGAAPATRPVQVGIGLVGLDLFHDALLAPAACGVGLLLARVLPQLVRGPVRAGLLATSVFVLVAWPNLRGYGRARVPDNPTVQPLDYGSALATVLAITWALVLLWVGARWWRQRARATRA